MSEQLSERGKDLVKYMPQAVNALADRIIEKLGERLLYEEKPQTNADSIRSMTDEELAEWLEAHCYQYGWLDWLKQEKENES